MLIGEYAGILAEKNRTALPKIFREALVGDVYLTKGYDKCLIVLDQEKWNRFMKTIESRPLLYRSVRDTKRFIVGSAQKISWDVQGRFVIPENLVKYAQINRNIVFVGILDWIEIWDADLWNAKQDELRSSAGEIAERLGNLMN